MDLMLLITVLMIILLIWNYWRADIIALTIMAVLGITQVLPVDKLFSGFSSTAVIAIIAAMIIGAGIEKAGVMQLFTTQLERHTPNRPVILTLILSMLTALMSGILSSAGAISLMMPTINRLAVKRKIPKSRLLMPIGFCAIAGSTITLVGSGSLLVFNDLLLHHHYSGLKSINLFTLTPISLVGLFALFLSFLFLFRFLPNTEKSHIRYGADSDQFRKIYGHGGHFFEVKVPKNHALLSMDGIS